ncbi:MAG: hypothetical protein RLZZ264_777, partial [Bacillota bacterium]
MMMDLKRLLLAGILLTACGTSVPNQSIKLKVWGPQQEQNFLFGAAERYQEANPDLNIEFEIAAV